MIYLIEPYNAHQKPPKKKHWTEIAEEEALHYKIAMEHDAQSRALMEARLQALQQMAIDEAIATRNHSNQNVALPQYTPQPPAQQVQDAAYAAPAGGGGWALPQDLEPFEQAEFSATPQLGFAPLSVAFQNLSPTPGNDTFLWNFGSGSLTSSAVNPTPVTYTQTGSYVITLTETSSTGRTSVASHSIRVLDTVFVDSLVLVSQDNTTGPTSASFTVTTAYVGPGTITGFLRFGDNTSASYTGDGTYTHAYQSGSFTASLQLTESTYNKTAASTASISASAPTIVPAFTFVTSSGQVNQAQVPVTASFTNTSTIVTSSYDSVIYSWDFGSGSLANRTSSLATPPNFFYLSGSTVYTVKLAITESSYNRQVAVTHTISASV